MSPIVIETVWETDAGSCSFKVLMKFITGLMREYTEEQQRLRLDKRWARRNPTPVLNLAPDVEWVIRWTEAATGDESVSHEGTPLPWHAVCI